jgi:hypothetical protein
VAFDPKWDRVVSGPTNILHIDEEKALGYRLRDSGRRSPTRSGVPCSAVCDYENASRCALREGQAGHTWFAEDTVIAALDPTWAQSAEWLVMRALIEHETNDRDASLRTIRRALELAPDHERAGRLLSEWSGAST